MACDGTPAIWSFAPQAEQEHQVSVKQSSTFRTPFHRSPGHQVEGGSLAVILVVRSANRSVRL